MLRTIGIVLLANHLIVFAKYPEAGRVKTRLAKRIGTDAAALAYKGMVEAVLARVAPPDGAYSLTVHFDPPEREADFRKWLSTVPDWRPQCPGDLGQRLQAAFHHSFAQGVQRALVIGTDCTDLDSALLIEALARLGDHDVVLGPAEDGGYYLIGLKEEQPSLFEGIAWSSVRVLDQTCQRAMQAQLSLTCLPVLADIDS